MRLTYLAANQAWAFTLGDSLVRLQDSDMFYVTRCVAVTAARLRGLRVNPDGSVEVERQVRPSDICRDPNCAITYVHFAGPRCRTKRDERPVKPCGACGHETPALVCPVCGNDRDC